MAERQVHFSVLLDESVEALVTRSDGVYVDATFGRGGHSRKILAKLAENGRLIALDKDPEAVAEGQKLQAEDPRFSIVHGSFAQLDEVLRSRGLGKIDGVLADLGVSSPQLDVAERGFSFNHDGPLDMRMNNSAGITAAEWINSADEQDIARVLKEYGEEKFSRRMARAIVEEREKQPITRTAHLAEIVKAANPKWEKFKHPATRAFQGIRIFINRELDDLDELLKQSLDSVCAGGRLVFISFHSLEDRRVKRFFRDESRGKPFPKGLPVTEDMQQISLKLVGKAIKAGEGELDQNIRSRSAVLRIAEKL